MKLNRSSIKQAIVLPKTVKQDFKTKVERAIDDSSLKTLPKFDMFGGYSESKLKPRKLLVGTILHNIPY